MSSDPKNRPTEKSDARDPRPEADDDARVREDGAGVEDQTKRKQAVDPALMPGGDPAGAA